MFLKLLLIGLILLLLFGGKRLGDIGKGLGEGIRNFKKGLGDEPKPTSAEESNTKIAVPRPQLKEGQLKEKRSEPPQGGTA
ncbi:MAG TPA: twin-arginine translocase TatA/TatE family subunit [Polyangiaceae bacterium]|nr:twin-arginine translocase TatA/TatE family subunit [Polyangiaceae bacterium]